MQRRLLATIALLGALVGAVLFGGAAQDESAYAGGDGPSISSKFNRGW